MSNNAEENSSKRKKTDAILEEEKHKKDVYQILEDDDLFEEFEEQGIFRLACWGLTIMRVEWEAEMDEETDKKLWYNFLANWARLGRKTGTTKKWRITS